MFKRIFYGFLFGIIVSFSVQAQELQAGVTILSNRVGSQVDHRIFQTLQSALLDFVNNRKWSGDNFQSNEKIVCNFLLDLSGALDNSTFQGSLTIQAARPVFNSTYQSPLINFMDPSVTFRYIQYQPLDFNENRVQGIEPFSANLTAIFAYYIYVVMGYYFDSFSLRGGDLFFQKALNVVYNAPEGANISGWNAFDGQRNRYILIENLTNPKYTPVHDAVYDYYRLGLDQMYDKDNDARNGVLNCLSLLNTVNTEFPNLMVMDIFFLGKANEISNVFKRAEPDQKNRALDYLVRLDIPNITKYKQDLQ